MKPQSLKEKLFDRMTSPARETRLSEAAALTRFKKAKKSNASTTLKEKLFDWYVQGEVGVSSEVIALTAVNKVSSWTSNHPHDSDDFRRCALLVARLPELRDSFDKVAALSPKWNTIIQNFDTLDGVLRIETNNRLEDGPATPFTNALIKKLGI